MHIVIALLICSTTKVKRQALLTWGCTATWPRVRMGDEGAREICGLVIFRPAAALCVVTEDASSRQWTLEDMIRRRSEKLVFSFVHHIALEPVVNVGEAGRSVQRPGTWHCSWTRIKQSPQTILLHFHLQVIKSHQRIKFNIILHQHSLIDFLNSPSQRIQQIKFMSN